MDKLANNRLADNVADKLADNKLPDNLEDSNFKKINLNNWRQA